jgi:ADP-heptose:LPS heptosyltransferase
VGALGDTLMVTPLLRALHKIHPEAQIDLLASGLASPLLECNPHIAKIYSLRNRNWPLFLSFEKQRLIRKLRVRRYDLAFLLESAPRYRRLIERAHPYRILSFKERPFDAGQHAIVNNLRVADIPASFMADLDMELLLTAEDMTAAQTMLRGLPGPHIGIHVGWGPLGHKRNQEIRQRGWRHTKFIQLIRNILNACKGSVLITGSSQDAGDAESICRFVDNPRLRSIAGRTRIRELAAVIKRLDLLISVDSGPCHMAAALGTPLVVLWGPGRLDQTKPISSASPIRIVRHPVPCAPCQSTPRQKSCRQNICMEAITPEEVFAAAGDLLQKASYPTDRGLLR